MSETLSKPTIQSWQTTLDYNMRLMSNYLMTHGYPATAIQIHDSLTDVIEILDTIIVAERIDPNA